MEKLFLFCFIVLLVGGIHAASVGSHPEGYKPLGNGYWKSDGGWEYYFANGYRDPKKWRKMDRVSGDLEVKNGGYACSSFDCYYNGIKIKALSGDLTVLSHNNIPTRYARDSFNAYWRGKKIRGISGDLKAVSLYYAVDSMSNAYFMGKKMRSVAGDIKSFGEGYAADDMSTLFYAGKKIGSSNGFKILGNGYASNSFTCFHKGKKKGGSYGCGEGRTLN